MARIKIKDVRKILRFEAEIFMEEDQDIEYVNRRVTAPKYKAIDRILKSITEDEEEQRKIYHVVTRNSFEMTFGELADELAKIGHTLEE